MRIVVTGTRGGQLVGSLLEKALGQSNLEVVAVGRPEIDLADPDTIVPVLVAKTPHVIINAAAYTAVDQAENEPDLAARINGIAAGRVAEAAAALKVPVVQISTDYVFDGTAHRPYRESDPVAPLGVYGRTKLEGERAVAAATPNYAIFRTAWLYSPFGNNFAKTMLRLGETRSQVNVVTDQRGSPTSALDLAAALLEASQRLIAEPDNSALRGIFHVTGTGEATWAEFADEIFRQALHFGRAPVAVQAITTDEYPTTARRPANSRLDCEKLERVYGLKLPEWRSSTLLCVARLLSAGA